jgi:hypothetical protein
MALVIQQSMTSFNVASNGFPMFLISLTLYFVVLASRDRKTIILLFHAKNVYYYKNFFIRDIGKRHLVELGLRGIFCAESHWFDPREIGTFSNTVFTHFQHIVVVKYSTLFHPHAMTPKDYFQNASMF